jgi:hypothetical protein
MKIQRSAYAVAAAALLGVAGLAGSGAALARDNVSIGLALPGISIGLNNGGYAPRPYYPAPVYAPAPVYYGDPYAQVVYAAPPVYVQPAPYYYGPSIYYSNIGHPYYGGHRGYWRR